MKFSLHLWILKSMAWGGDQKMQGKRSLRQGKTPTVRSWEVYRGLHAGRPKSAAQDFLWLTQQSVSSSGVDARHYFVLNSALKFCLNVKDYSRLSLFFCLRAINRLQGNP